MTAIGITGMGLTGVLRMTWVTDHLAHVLEHSQTDETSGTWTGLACPDHGLALGSRRGRRDAASPRRRGRARRPHLGSPGRHHRRTRPGVPGRDRLLSSGESKAAEELWEQVQAVWSHAWSANYEALEFLQDTGLTRFSPVKPQRWVVASFEHHCGPHGLPQPHIHNIVVVALTKGA